MRGDREFPAQPIMHNPNPHIGLGDISGALETYMRAIAELPYPGCFEFIHGGFEELTKYDFHIPGKPWLNPYELAHVANYVALYGDTRNSYSERFELNSSLNALKGVWSLAERENTYSDNDDYIACFLLRWVYQQLPYCIDPRRVLRISEIMRDLLSNPNVSKYVESSIGLNGRRLMDLSILLLRAFQRHASYRKSMILKLDSPSDEVRIAIKQYAADRTQREIFHQSRLEVQSAIEKTVRNQLTAALSYSRIRGRVLCPIS